MSFPEAATLEKRNGARLQIILAEDNPADASLVHLALNHAGLDFDLHVINDGDQAAAFISALDANPRAGAMDLLLLDMHLPKRDGDEILQRLRATDHYSQTPVIIMTASDAPRDYDLAIKHAVSHYFRKPFSLAEYMQLGDIVRSLLAPQSPAPPIVDAAGTSGVRG